MILRIIIVLALIYLVLINSQRIEKFILSLGNFKPGEKEQEKTKD